MKCSKTECPLYGQNVVPYDGNENAAVVYIGESPGFEEEKASPPRPFIGRAGKLAKEMTRMAGLNWADFAVLNAARCRIDKTAMGGKDITKTLTVCRCFVTAALHKIKPKIIIVAGDFAFRQICRKSGITKARKEGWLWSTEFDCWIRPTFHPAYVLRNMAQQPLVVEDLKSVKACIEAGFQPFEAKETVDYRDVETIDTLFQGERGRLVAFDTETQGLDVFDPNFLPISISFCGKSREAYEMVFYKEIKREAIKKLKEEEMSTSPSGRYIRLRKEVKRSAVNKSRSSVFVINTPKVGFKVPVNRMIAAVPGIKQKVQEVVDFLENPAIGKVTMAGQFDLRVLRRLSRDVLGRDFVIKNWVGDVQAAAHLLDENLFSMTSLETLRQLTTQYKEDYDSAFQKDVPKHDMLSADPDKRRHYACADVDVTRESFLTVCTKLKKTDPQLMRYLRNFSMPTMQTLAKMEYRGVHLDLGQMEVSRTEILQRKENLLKKAISLMPKSVRDKHDGNLALTRWDLVKDVLFSPEGFRLPIVKTTKRGLPDTIENASADKEARSALLGLPRMPKKAEDFILAFEEWSELQTLTSRYFNGLRKAVKSDNRIHSKFTICKTKTGRVASSDPNMMNIPKRSANAKYIRRLLVARPGYVFLAADESQSELRWLAEISRDPAMLQVFREGRDIHTETAKALAEKSAGVNWDSLPTEVQAVHRRNAKPVNFGLIYLMSLWGFLKYCRMEYKVELSEEKGQEYIDIYFDKYQGVTKYHQKTLEYVRRTGYVRSVFGRRRRLPEVLSQDKGVRGYAERQAVNHPIQGPSSDTVLVAANDIEAQGFPEDEFRLVLFIHDELIAEVREDLADKYAPVLKYHLENPSLQDTFGYTMNVPLKSDVKIGKNLADMKDFLA